MTHRVVTLDALPEEPAFRTRWNELARQTDSPEPFYTYEWHAAVVASGLAGPLELMLIEDGGLLKGIVCFQRSGRQGRSLRFLGQDATDYNDILSAPEDRGNVLASVLRHAAGRSIALANVPRRSPTSAAIFDVARKSGWHAILRSKEVSPRIAWTDAAAGAVLARDMRRKSSVRRHESALCKLGQLSVVHHDSPEAILGRLPAFYATHTARFISTGRRSPLLEATRRRLLEKVAADYARQTGLVLSELRLGDTCIAWNLGFRFGGKWLWYMPTFDPAHAAHWPGEVLLALLLEAAVSTAGCRSLDLGLGGEFYKTRFANHMEETVEFRLECDTLRAIRSRLAAGVAQRAAAGGRVSSALVTTGRKMRRLAHTVRVRGARKLFITTVRRVRELAWLREGIVAYRAVDSLAPHTASRGSTTSLVPLDWRRLAQTALQWAHTTASLDYLDRCSPRLATGGNAGHLLLSTEGVALHCLWIAPMEGFYVSEVSRAFGVAWRNKALIFDCWTPPGHRGERCYPEAIRLAAQMLREGGLEAWIFASENNLPSLRGIEWAGFEKRLRIRSTRIFGCRRIEVVRLRRTGAECSPHSKPEGLLSGGS